MILIKSKGSVVVRFESKEAREQQPDIVLTPDLKVEGPVTPAALNGLSTSNAPLTSLSKEDRGLVGYTAVYMARALFLNEALRKALGEEKWPDFLRQYMTTDVMDDVEIRLPTVNSFPDVASEKTRLKLEELWHIACWKARYGAKPYGGKGGPFTATTRRPLGTVESVEAALKVIEAGGSPEEDDES